jgi:hypothetical protein
LRVSGKILPMRAELAIKLGLILMLSTAALAQVGTSSSDGGATSLGEVARKTRSANAGHSAKVYTNENLPKQGGISVVGSNNAAPSAATEPVIDGKTTETQWRNALAQQQGRVKELQQNLAVAEQNQQRTTNSTTLGPNPWYERFTNQVETLKQQLADAKQQLIDMQEEARKAGVARSDE